MTAHPTGPLCRFVRPLPHAVSGGTADGTAHGTAHGTAGAASGDTSGRACDDVSGAAIAPSIRFGARIARQMTRRVAGRVAMLGAVCALSACLADDPQFDPSGHAIAAPTPGLPFDEYIHQTNAQITDVLAQNRFGQGGKPFGKYSLADVAAMRSPFAAGPDRAACNDAGNDARHGAGLGILMVHGLTDTPFLMSDLRDGLAMRLPCAEIHGIILPGHGTVPGDLRDVRLADWQAAVSYGFDSFAPDIEKIVAIGYSTGAALIGREYDARRSDNRAGNIAGLAMLSPGLAAKSDLAWLTPYIRYVRPWVNREENSDAAKYNSMAMNGAAEFYKLTEPYRDSSMARFDLPVFMAVSSDDQTINPLAALDFFCNRTASKNRRLIWYQGIDHTIDDLPQCDDIDTQDAAFPDWRTLNIAHTAMTMRPDNPHYGMDGVIRRCDHYSDQAANSDCQTRDDVVYGETNLASSATPGSLRRGTFNPDFTRMVDKLTFFIEQAVAPAPQ